MRGKARWGSLGTFVFMVSLMGCGGDDGDTPGQDGGADSGRSDGRGRMHGGDAGRADTSSRRRRQWRNE